MIGCRLSGNFVRALSGDVSGLAAIVAEAIGTPVSLLLGGERASTEGTGGVDLHRYDGRGLGDDCRGGRWDADWRRSSVGRRRSLSTIEIFMMMLNFVRADGNGDELVDGREFVGRKGDCDMLLKPISEHDDLGSFVKVGSSGCRLEGNGILTNRLRLSKRRDPLDGRAEVERITESSFEFGFEFLPGLQPNWAIGFGVVGAELGDVGTKPLSSDIVGLEVRLS